MNFLGKQEMPFCILFTKSDKLKPKQLEVALQQYQESVLEELEEMPPYFITSSTHAKGREEVLDYIQRMNAIFTGSPH